MHYSKLFTSKGSLAVVDLPIPLPLSLPSSLPLSLPLSPQLSVSLSPSLLQLLLHDFTHHNLEMACLFIEHCGRYLIRSPDSHLRAKALLVSTTTTSQAYVTFNNTCQARLARCSTAQVVNVVHVHVMLTNLHVIK